VTPNETNEKLAEVLIHRLNHLLDEDATLGETLGLLMRARVMCSRSVSESDTIQVHEDGGAFYVGFLGMLNGIVGAIPEGEYRAGWGYVMAIVESDGSVSSFVNTRHHKEAESVTR
jgi:hypothetical protein